MSTIYFPILHVIASYVPAYVFICFMFPKVEVQR
jgi:hypothetical protein